MLRDIKERLVNLTEYLMYKDSLSIIKPKINNAFLSNFLYKQVPIKTVDFMYEKIDKVLVNLSHNTFCILTVNREFELYDFFKSSIITTKYTQKDIKITKTITITSLIDKNTVFMFCTEEKVFFDLFNQSIDLDSLYKTHNNKKFVMIFVTTDTFTKIDESIIKESVVSSLFSEIKLYNYLKTVIVNILNYELYVYSSPDLEQSLKANIFGQEKAISSILLYAQNLDTRSHSINKPIGSWLLCGPSGTGKTALAKALAYSMFGSLDNLIKIDMSEYSESSSISKLIGSPVGYAGYGNETILSRRFLQSSSFVVLFDEIEKANKSVLDIMLQLLDEGRLTFSTGRILDFRSSFILFTSNLGYTNKDDINKVTPSSVMAAINEFFRAELLNRINAIILFDSIAEDSYFNVFSKFIKEASLKFNFYIDITDRLKMDLIKLYYDKSYGSRPLKRVNIYFFNFVNAMHDVLEYSSSGLVKHLWNFSEERVSKLM